MCSSTAAEREPAPRRCSPLPGGPAAAAASPRFRVARRLFFGPPTGLLTPTANADFSAQLRSIACKAILDFLLAWWRARTRRAPPGGRGRSSVAALAAVGPCISRPQGSGNAQCDRAAPKCKRARLTATTALARWRSRRHDSDGRRQILAPTHTAMEYYVRCSSRWRHRASSGRAACEAATDGDSVDTMTSTMSLSTLLISKCTWYANIIWA